MVFRLDIDQISFTLVDKLRHLQHDSLPFLPLASRFLARACAYSGIFWTRKWPTSLGFSTFYYFSPFLFLLFFFFLLQWSTFYWAYLQLKNFSSINETGNFYHGLARCSGRKFCPEFFLNVWAFLWIFQASLGRSLWSGHHWKDLLFQQTLRIL